MYKAVLEAWPLLLVIFSLILAIVIVFLMINRRTVRRVRRAAEEIDERIEETRHLFSFWGREPTKETVAVGIVNAIFTVAWLICSAFSFKVGLTMMIIHIIYTLMSLRPVGPTDQGLLLFFGKPVKEVGSGLVYAPLGILSLMIETKNNIQDELPADPEFIYHGDDPIIPEGKYPPIRVTFGPRATLTDGDKTNDEAALIPDDDPYNKRLTAEVTPVVTWRIDSMMQFVQTVGSVAEARRQMEDAAISVFTAEFSKMTPAAALQKLNEVSDRLERTLEQKVRDQRWGVTIVDAQIKPFGFSHALNTAVVQLSVVEQEAKQTRTRADAEKYKRQREGEGTGEGEKAALAGRAKGLKEIASVAGTPAGQRAMEVEAGRAALEKARFNTIVPMDNLLGILGGAGTLLKQPEGQPDDSDSGNAEEAGEPTGPANTASSNPQPPNQPDRPRERRPRSNKRRRDK